jgi:hypothetical protein
MHVRLHGSCTWQTEQVGPVVIRLDTEQFGIAVARPVRSATRSPSALTDVPAVSAVPFVKG